MDEREIQAKSEREVSQTVHEDLAQNENVEGKSPESNDSEGESPSAAVDEVVLIEELENLITEKDAQIENHVDRIKRIQADFENYKKRIAKEHEQIGRQIENRVYLKFLPLFDSFVRAFDSFSEQADNEAFIEGISKIYSQFEDLLEGAQIASIEALGKPFDPLHHEALLSVESDEPPNTVLEEFERGYLRSTEVLRPSRVKVSKKREVPVQEEMPDEDETNERGEA